MKNRNLSPFFLFIISALFMMNASLFAKEIEKEVEAETKTKTKVSQTITSIISTKVEGKYFEVVHNLRQAILGKGIHIAHELHASDMLQRTADAFGYKKSVYSNAQILEFCSAELSQKLSRIDPDNIVMCPFVIGVYALTGDDENVHITYRIPYGKPGTEEVTKDVVELISGIIEDASW